MILYRKFTLQLGYTVDLYYKADSETFSLFSAPYAVVKNFLT